MTVEMTPSPLQTLAELKRSAQESSASLLGLELDPERKLLEAATLEGISADQRSRASALSVELWRRQALLEDLLVRAEEAGRRRRSPELAALVEGPSIDLGRSSVKPEARSLLAARELCSPGELLTGMAAMFDEVKGVYELFAQTWKTLIPRLESVQALAERAMGLVGVSAGDERRRLEAPLAAVASFARAVARDPLSIRPEAITQLGDELESLRAELERSVELRTTFPAAFAAAHTQLGVLREVHAEARAAHEELTVKIAKPGAPPPPQRDETLDIELVSIGQLAEDGAWLEARHSLDALGARIDAAARAARHSIDAYRAPLDARNQLRDLLLAYQVKASRLGLIEQPDVAAIYRAAEAELYNAPTDLARAEKLVRSYQDALSDSPTGEVER